MSIDLNVSKSAIGSSLRGRTALITGSTSGIGAGIAAALAASGMNIVLNGLCDAQEIEVGRSKLAKDHDVKVSYDPANMMVADEIAAMIARATSHFGGIDVLVNNAGVQHVAYYPDDSIQDHPDAAVLRPVFNGKSNMPVVP